MTHTKDAEEYEGAKGWLNTDKEIWRERAGDYYADSIHVTEQGGIGINCGGHVIVAPIRRWHRAGEQAFCVYQIPTQWRYRVAAWLLRRVCRLLGVRAILLSPRTSLDLRDLL